MFVVFSAGREHRRVLPISQLHPRNAASQTGALQTTKIYLLGLTKQKRPTRKRMLCSQFSVLGENTDAYCPLASYIHGTRQARLVHFKQQKFTSLDLRSRNAQREKECYVRSFQCWARTQTRTAHQLATSTERGKLDWCTSNNKNLPPWTYEAETPNAKNNVMFVVFSAGREHRWRTAHQLATSTERGKLDWCTSNNKNLHPWTYEAETLNAKKNVMFVVFSAGREHRRVLPISQLHPRNAASQTGALQTTKIYLLGLTKQKRPTPKRMLCSQFSVLGENTDAYCPLASYIHGTRQARLVHFKQQKFTSLDLRSRNYPTRKRNVRSHGREHRRILSQLHMSRNYGYQPRLMHFKQQKFTSMELPLSQYSCQNYSSTQYGMSWNYLYQQYNMSWNYLYRSEFSCAWSENHYSNTHAHQLTTSSDRGKLDSCHGTTSIEADTPNAKKNVMNVVFTAGRELSHGTTSISNSQTGHQTTKIYIHLRSRNAKLEKECHVRSFQCYRAQTRMPMELPLSVGTRQARLELPLSAILMTYMELPRKSNVMFVVSAGNYTLSAILPMSWNYLHRSDGMLDWCYSNSKNLHHDLWNRNSIGKRLMSWNYLYQQYSCPWNYLYRSDSCHGTTSLDRQRLNVMELPHSFQCYSVMRTTSSVQTHVTELRLSAIQTCLGLTELRLLVENSCHGSTSVLGEILSHGTTSISNSSCHGKLDWYFKQPKFILDLRSRNANTHVMELPLSADSCHGTTSIELDSCHGTTSRLVGLMPRNYLYWQYSSHETTLTAKKKVMFVVSSAGREHMSRNRPISQLHHGTRQARLVTSRLMSWTYYQQKRPCRKKNVIVRTHVMDTTSISYTTCHGTTSIGQARLVTVMELPLSKQKRHVMELPRSFWCWARSDAYCPSQLIHGTRQARLVSWNNKNLLLDLRSRNAMSRNGTTYVQQFSCHGTQTLLAHQLAHPRNVASQTGALQTAILMTYMELPLTVENSCYVRSLPAGREHRRVHAHGTTSIGAATHVHGTTSISLDSCHGTTSIVRSFQCRWTQTVLPIGRSYMPRNQRPSTGKTSCQQKFTSYQTILKQKHHQRKDMLCSNYSSAG